MTSALKEMAAVGSATLFHEVILAAPDIDADVFRREIAPAITKVSNRVTLYASDKDEALAMSQQVHQDHRAGQAGKGIVLARGIDTVDATLVDTGLIGHSYYGDNRSVLTDIYLLLSKGLPPGDRNLKAATLNDFKYWMFKP
jgi:esterase/lipase superfamily enzyme